MKIEPRDFRLDFNVQRVDHDDSVKNISVWVRSPVLGYEFNTTRMDNQVCFTWDVGILDNHVLEDMKSHIIGLLEFSMESDLRHDDSPNFAITRKPNNERS